MTLQPKLVSTPSRLPANAHIHLPPNFSAFESVSQAVGLAAEQGVRVLGASNYYDFDVYAEFAHQAGQNGIYPLFGLEIIALLDDLQKKGVKLNDPGNPGKLYLCGKGITEFAPMLAKASGLMNVIREKDSLRMRAVTKRMAEVFSEAGLETGLDELAVKEGIVRRHGCDLDAVYLQERHVAQAFQESLFSLIPEERRADALARLFGAPSKSAPDDAIGIQNEIRSHLMKAGKPAYVPETFVDFDHAYSLILALGGIPCYPTLADGASPVCAFEEPVKLLISRIVIRGIYCAEFIPIRNSPEVLTRYVTAMRRAGIVVTSGTEHNTLDLLPIAPTCLNGEPIPPEVEEIFWEGACVVAGHQVLCAKGEAGYVDSAGHLNPAYSKDEDRIRAFREIGEAAIRAAV